MNRFIVKVEGEIIIDTNLSRDDFLLNYVVSGAPYEWYIIANEVGEQVSIKGRDMISLMRMPCKPSSES